MFVNTYMSSYADIHKVRVYSNVKVCQHITRVVMYINMYLYLQVGPSTKIWVSMPRQALAPTHDFAHMGADETGHSHKHGCIG